MSLVSLLDCSYNNQTMKQLRLILISFFCSSFAFAQGGLKERLQRVLGKSPLQEKEVGAYVSIRQNGQAVEVWGRNEKKNFIPASLTKVLTAGAVLEILGPSRKLETRLMATATQSGTTLEGDLYLVGGGDPGFVSETMWFLVNEFVRTGIKQIAGKIIVDDSKFDRIRSDQTRQEQRVDRAYDAPVGAMSFNWNSVNVYVRPGLKEGQPALVFLDPENSYTELKGSVKTIGGRASNVSVERLPVNEKSNREQILVSGQIGVGAMEFVAYKNISRPEIWSGHQLVSFLAQRGIKVSGTVQAGTAPATARLLAKAESKPVAHMVADMLKFSNNFVAEMLVKNLATQVPNSVGTLAAGNEEIKKYLLGVGLGKETFHLESPSGFSRKNEFQPLQLHAVLEKMHNDFSVFPEAMAGLPLAGVDGTLKSRMKNSPAAGEVRAKTGLLDGVVGLAGYANGKRGDLITFVFVFNGRSNKSEDARATFDQMAKELVQ